MMLMHSRYFYYIYPAALIFIVWLNCLVPSDDLTSEKLDIGLCKDRNGVSVYKTGDTLFLGDTIPVLLKVNRYVKLLRLTVTIMNEKVDKLKKEYLPPFSNMIIGSPNDYLILDSTHIEGFYAISFVASEKQFNETKTIDYTLYLIGKGRGARFKHDTIKKSELAIFSKTFHMYAPPVIPSSVVYTWIHNGIVLPVNNNTLSMTLSYSDTGNYLCIASNTYGSDTTLRLQLPLKDFKFPPALINNQLIVNPIFPQNNQKVIFWVPLSGGDRPLLFYWFKDNLCIDTTIDTDSLVINSFTDTDVGHYGCKVENNYGFDSTVNVPVTSKKKPFFNPKTIFSNPQRPYRGYPFKLYAKAFHTGLVVFKWYKGTDTLIAQKPPSDTLKFGSLGYSNEGAYYCIVADTFGSDTSDKFSLKVLEPFCAKIESPNKTIEIISAPVLEEQCVMRINASGSDTLRYKWYKNDILVYTIKSVDTFRIISVDKNSTGNYRVIVENQFGADTSQWYHLVPIVPSIVLDNNKNILALGNNIVGSFFTMRIKIKEGKVTGYQWYKNEKPLTLNTLDYIAFNQLKKEDAGDYYCTALNKYDTAQSNMYHLTVDSTIRPNRPPQISIKNVRKGESLKIKEMNIMQLTLTVLDPDTGDNPTFLMPHNMPPSATFDSLRGIFTYTPTFSVSTGSENKIFSSIRFYAQDNRILNNGIDTFPIHLVVLDSNRQPLWKKNADTVAMSEGLDLSYDVDSLLFFGDPDGDSVLFSTTFGKLTSVTNVLTWKSGFMDASTKLCFFTATDNRIPPASSKASLVIMIKDSVVPVTLSMPFNISRTMMHFKQSVSKEPEFVEYRIRYSTTPGVTEQSMDGGALTDIGGTDLEFFDLSPNTTYYFRLYVVNRHGTKNGSNEVFGKTLP